MPEVCSVTSVGGGVIGCFLVYRLALEGMPVTVYVAVPSTNGFLLSAVMADRLTALLVRGEQHPLLAAVLPVQAMQHTV